MLISVERINLRKRRREESSVEPSSALYDDLRQCYADHLVGRVALMVNFNANRNAVLFLNNCKTILKAYSQRRPQDFRWKNQRGETALFWFIEELTMGAIGLHLSGTNNRHKQVFAKGGREIALDCIRIFLRVYPSAVHLQSYDKSYPFMIHQGPGITEEEWHEMFNACKSLTAEELHSYTSMPLEVSKIICQYISRPLCQRFHGNQNIIHRLLDQRSPFFFSRLKHIVSVEPELLRMADNLATLPIHKFCTDFYFSLNLQDAVRSVEMLLSTYPQSAINQNMDGQNPLHLALMVVMNRVVHGDRLDRLLHLAQAIHRYFPDAMSTVDSEGNTVLHNLPRIVLGSTCPNRNFIYEGMIRLCPLRVFGYRNKKGRTVYDCFMMMPRCYRESVIDLFSVNMRG